MRTVVRFLFLKPILWLVQKFSSAPDRTRIFAALDQLKIKMETDPGKKGFVIPFDYLSGKFIIFSDHHKGAKNGADDFMLAEANYLAALSYYDLNNFHLICLGDCEELWENLLLQVKKHNQPSFHAEKKFALRNAFTKIFGNHDLDWEINPTAPKDLKEIYATTIAILEGVMLQSAIGGKVINIFCTHGHQGDAQSDGNWFSKFFVAKIWAPWQAYLKINPNTPAYHRELKTAHNNIMYEWSSQQKNLVLITGHTHQPVFESLTHYERLRYRYKEAVAQKNHLLMKQIETEMQWHNQNNNVTQNDVKVKPTYFNSGCCCFDDGDITGLEIADGTIRLIKWEEQNGVAVRIILEQKELAEIVKALD